jgi:hypothetical protein
MWNGYKNPKTVIIDDLDYNDILDFSITRVANTFPSVVYQILPDNLTQDDIDIVNLNLKNSNITQMHLFANFPKRDISFDDKAGVIKAIYWKYSEYGWKFTDILQKFQKNAVNILLFDVVFFQNNDLFNAKILSHNEIGLICAAEISNKHKNTPQSAIETLVKPLPPVMTSYSGIIVLETIDLHCDIYAGWYGGSNILIKRLYETKRLMNLSNLFRCYMIPNNKTFQNNYINLDEFHLIFSSIYKPISDRNENVNAIHSSTLLEALTSVKVDALESYTFKDIQKKRNVFTLENNIEFVDIQNTLIHNFYKKYSELYNSKIVSIDEDVMAYEKSIRENIDNILEQEKHRVIKETEEKYIAIFKEECRQRHESIKNEYDQTIALYKSKENDFILQSKRDIESKIASVKDELWKAHDAEKKTLVDAKIKQVDAEVENYRTQQTEVINHKTRQLEQDLVKAHTEKLEVMAQEVSKYEQELKKKITETTEETTLRTITEIKKKYNEIYDTEHKKRCADMDAEFANRRLDMETESHNILNRIREENAVRKIEIMKIAKEETEVEINDYKAEYFNSVNRENTILEMERIAYHNRKTQELDNEFKKKYSECEALFVAKQAEITDSLRIMKESGIKKLLADLSSGPF